MKEKEIEELMGGLLASRELTDQEKDRRFIGIEEYLLSRGGIIIAASCKDGIFLAGTSPSDNRTIFQVFHRIALLGLGKARDCQDIHRLALSLACSTGINLSKADIDARDIAEEIARELDEKFSYLKARRGPYKADFIVTEIGFTPEEDYLNVISFFGEKGLKDLSHNRGLGILERPVFRELVTNKDGDPKKDKKGSTKTKEAARLKIEPIYPISAALTALIKEMADFGVFIESIREVALFAGLMIRLLNERAGEPEMAYLDRVALEKTRLEERRFHHIWQRITNPNPYKSSDPWQDWKKFVAPIYKKAKAGEMHPKPKLLIEFYEAFAKELEKESHLLRKLELSKIYLANYDFVMNLFGKKQENNKE